MNLRILEKGLLTDDQIKKLSYLSYSNEAKGILALITFYTRKYKRFLQTSFLLNIIATVILLLTIVLSRSIFVIGKSDSYIMVLALLIFFSVVIFFRQMTSHYMQGYTRVISELFDKLLSFILDDYKLSLADVPMEYPNVKEISKDLSIGGNSLLNFLDVLKNFLGFFISIVVFSFIWLITSHNLYIFISLEILILIVIFFVFLLYGGMHKIYLLDYKKYCARFDRLFNNSQPLLSRTSIGFNEDRYNERLEQVISASDIINIISYLISYIIPLFLIFLPFLLKDDANWYLYIVMGLIVSAKLFSQSTFINQLGNIFSANKAVTQIDALIGTIMEKGTEMTPEKYRHYAADYLREHKAVKLTNDIVWGDLQIEDLYFSSGRVEPKKRICATSLIIPHKKVSILIGDKGVGKSIFGRLITLRYDNFEAKSIRLGDKDIRTFKSLDDGLSFLHYSGLRNINTTYRNALSMYLKEAHSTNIFVKKVFNFDVKDIRKVKEHFIRNEEYYDDVNKLILPILSDSSLKITSVDLTNGYTELFSEVFQNFSYLNPLTRVLIELSSKMDKKRLNKALAYSAIAEYIAFEHLKTYVPEANLYFMDANLSEPPVSLSQRKRSLYALDVFMEGLVFVVDEPFSSLDSQNAERIIKDLVDYSQTYNAIVLILDEQINQDVFDKYKGKNVLGKIYRFEDDGYALNIKANDLD